MRRNERTFSARGDGNETRRGEGIETGWIRIFFGRIPRYLRAELWTPGIHFGNGCGAELGFIFFHDSCDFRVIWLLCSLLFLRIEYRLDPNWLPVLQISFISIRFNCLLVIAAASITGLWDTLRRRLLLRWNIQVFVALIERKVIILPNETRLFTYWLGNGANLTTYFNVPNYSALREQFMIHNYN